MIPPQERLVQLARLIGRDAFVEKFGSPQTARPDAGELSGLVAGRLEQIARGLIEEAAAMRPASVAVREPAPPSLRSLTCVTISTSCCARS